MNGHLFSGGEILLDRYKIDRYLDEGGMQQVYVAVDSRFDRPVALKVPKNPTAEKRFARSAQVSARVTHANVAKTLDYFEVAGRSHLIEELIDGSDLRHVLEKRFAFLDPHLAAHVVHKVAKGLAASHHAGVFHRDLKPNNIMVSRDSNLNVVKITDFGIAKLAEHEIVDGMKDESSITGSQTVLGALPYMSPELIARPKEAGLPADVWALGAMLFRLLSGDVPFGTGLAAIPTILEAKLPQKPNLLKQNAQLAILADSLWTIVERCLQKDVASRPTADQLVEMCDQLCYSEEQRFDGVVTGFQFGAYGYIESEDGSQVFFHRDSCYGTTPLVGSRVNFASFDGHPNRRAFPVLALK
jgi:serine/threonine protein kinase